MILVLINNSQLYLMEVYKMQDHLRLTIGTPKENDIFMNKLIQSYE